jgi:peptidoglycan-N-acetylglucosamine deacetylase
MKKLVLIVLVILIAGLLGLLFLVEPTEAPVVFERTVEEEKVVEPKYFSYVINSESSFGALKKNVSKLDGIFVQAGYISASEEFKVNNQATQIEILAWLEGNATNVPVYAWVNNYAGGWQGSAVNEMLAHPDVFIENLSSFTEEYSYDGLSLDLESLPDDAYGKLPSFLEKLSSRLHEKEKVLSIHFYIDDLKVSYGGVVPFVDQVILMAYDQHDSTTVAGPVASVPWIRENLERVKVPSEKLILGLGNYGYDWSRGKARSISVASALSTDSEIKFDQEQGNPWYTYRDTEGFEHEVWFLDQRSVLASIESTDKFNPYGYAIFRLGSEDPKVWDILVK